MQPELNQIRSSCTANDVILDWHVSLISEGRPYRPSGAIDGGNSSLTRPSRVDVELDHSHGPALPAKSCTLVRHYYSQHEGVRQLRTPPQQSNGMLLVWRSYRVLVALRHVDLDGCRVALLEAEAAGVGVVDRAAHAGPARHQ